ncbi:hypothetical protein B4U80_13988 [Leptotrombidium deliense]|uniref:Uncharacterized protein n=1 Tax=Leptotrombidium deliense TaxID=299467 RepID=A0A443S5P3_9ACAR|nr:hypothetical protein B4U80_13988 [Leptotrombidium deliense]
MFDTFLKLQCFDFCDRKEVNGVLINPDNSLWIFSDDYLFKLDLKSKKVIGNYTSITEIFTEIELPFGDVAHIFDENIITFFDGDDYFAYNAKMEYKMPEKMLFKGSLSKSNKIENSVVKQLANQKVVMCMEEGESVSFSAKLL